ncbi:glutathione S-transferase family protein (plasmid) [Microvirga terrae]|uniref:Glutathione S-transferase family protein n=1 Tax=Microvirga terrae TaxID=2740529 RepID=A0ABY5RZI5_9HYPH|nr:glutathione S-transferase family protein [Microvirga terrae]UVF22668.1 glutathione S-transferase family protein [Microvirga terrae]
MLKIFGAVGSGSVPIEAMLTLLGVPYEVIEAVTWEDEAARERVETANPLGQVPTLVLPSGEVITESAAILIYLADLHPQARLAPGLNDPNRAQYLRWMTYVSAAIYAFAWIKDDPMRITASDKLAPEIIDRIHDRIADCWHMMDDQITPGRYILGDELSVLDLYVTVISRFAPWRSRFYKSAPKMAEIVRQVDTDPRLNEFWAKRFPFDEGWER